MDKELRNNVTTVTEKAILLVVDDLMISKVPSKLSGSMIVAL